MQQGCAALGRFLSNDIPACLSFRPSSALCQPLHSLLCVGWHTLNTNENSAHPGISLSGNRLNGRRTTRRYSLSVNPLGTDSGTSVRRSMLPLSVKACRTSFTPRMKAVSVINGPPPALRSSISVSRWSPKHTPYARIICRRPQRKNNQNQPALKKYGFRDGRTTRPSISAASWPLARPWPVRRLSFNTTQRLLFPLAGGQTSTARPTS